MRHSHLPFAAAVAVALLAATTLVTAQGVEAEPQPHRLGEHPAVLVKRQAQTVDANHFILMHPAGLFVIAAPAQPDAPPAVALAPAPRPNRPKL